jgi:hypothetical protein
MNSLTHFDTAALFLSAPRPQPKTGGVERVERVERGQADAGAWIGPAGAFGGAIKTQSRNASDNRGIRGIRGKKTGQLRNSAYSAYSAVHSFGGKRSQPASNAASSDITDYARVRDFSIGEVRMHLPQRLSSPIWNPQCRGQKKSQNTYCLY